MCVGTSPLGEVKEEGKRGRGGEGETHERYTVYGWLLAIIAIAIARLCAPWLLLGAQGTVTSDLSVTPRRPTDAPRCDMNR